MLSVQLHRPGRGPGGVAAFVGIEQEFEVWHRDERTDFRDLIHTLGFDGLRLDPGDRNAYRLRNGLAVTCDEAEAEIASPPIEVRPGFTDEVQRWAALGRRTVEAALPSGFTLRGYSTHVNVSLPGPPDAEFAEAWARSFGPLYALVVELPESLGIYVRPRPERLELCSEFVEGARLGAAAAFAAGATRSAAAGQLSAGIKVELRACVERFGYRVTRDAAGFDVYARGRCALFLLANGGEETAHALFAEAVRIAGDSMGEGFDADFRHLTKMADGAAPLGVEVTGAELEPELGPPAADSGVRATESWRSGGVLVEPIATTWAFSLFHATSGSRERFAVVPRGELREFSAAMDIEPGAELKRIFATDDGALDGPGQVSSRGSFSSLDADLVELLAPEIPIAGGKPVRGDKRGRGGKGGGRAFKGRTFKSVPGEMGPLRTPEAPPPAGSSGTPMTAGPGSDQPPSASSQPAPAPPNDPPGPPWGIISAVAAGILAIAAIAGGLALSGDSSSPEATPTATATATFTVRPTETPRAQTATPSPSPTVRPSETVVPTATAIAAGAAVTQQPPTETPRPTETQTRTATPTIRPTETPGPTVTPTSTPTATATPTPAATLEPFPTLAPIPTPITKGCTPTPGTVC